MFINIGTQSKTVYFSCDDLKGLCPGQSYEVTCSVQDSVLFQQLSVINKNCSKSEIEFDVKRLSKQIDEEISDDTCGTFRGVSHVEHRKDGSSIRSIKVTFNTTKYIDGAEFRCFGQGLHGEGLQEQLNFVSNVSCGLSLARSPPEQPKNMSISDCRSPAVVSWEQPPSTRRADDELTYHVTITSSSGMRKNLTLSKTFFLLNMKATDKFVNYTVCVSAQNCFGVSPPICKKRLVG